MTTHVKQKNIKQKNIKQSGGSFVYNNMWLILKILGLTFMFIGVAYECQADPVNQKICNSMYPSMEPMKDHCNAPCTLTGDKCVPDNIPCFSFLMINTIAEPFWLALVFAISVSIYTLVRTYMKIDDPYNFHIPHLTNHPIDLMTLSGFILIICELKQIVSRSNETTFLGFINCTDVTRVVDAELKGGVTENNMRNFISVDTRGAVLKIIAIICLLSSVYMQNIWEKYNKKRGIKYTPLINLFINTLQDPFWFGGAVFLVAQIICIYTGKNEFQTGMDCKTITVNEDVKSYGNSDGTDWSNVYKLGGEDKLVWRPKEGGKMIFFITKLISFATGTQGVSALGTTF